jgi:hypothetical protein
VTVQALFIDPEGHYPSLLGPGNCWDQARDASNYNGPDPVVAHPPCSLWVNLTAVNWKRYQRQLPAWYPGGSDEGCFANALACVRQYGGVLEHPGSSHAWKQFGLKRPVKGAGWGMGQTDLFTGLTEWTCEVFQSAYGHKAAKRTWLLFCGKQPPFQLNWERIPGTCQVGWFDRNKPTLSKKEASRSPVEFALELIRLAEWSKG